MRTHTSPSTGLSIRIPQSVKPSPRCSRRIRPIPSSFRRWKTTTLTTPLLAWLRPSPAQAPERPHLDSSPFRVATILDASSNSPVHSARILSIREEIQSDASLSLSSPRRRSSTSLRTADVVGRFVDTGIEESGLTGQQYNVLRILRGAGERGLPTLDIAERMIEETPGITRLIDRLEAKGLVTASAARTDRRQVFCRITPSGLALLAELDGPMERGRRARARVAHPAEVTQLIGLLDRTREHVNQRSHPGTTIEKEIWHEEADSPSSPPSPHCRPRRSAADTYNVDKDHSEAKFEVRHLREQSAAASSTTSAARSAATPQSGRIRRSSSP